MLPLPLLFMQVNAVNCNTSWKVALFMKFSDYREDVLKGVRCFLITLVSVSSLYRFSRTACSVHVFGAHSRLLSCSCLMSCVCPLSGRRGEAVSCWAGEVSDLWRVQEAAACLSQDHAAAICHLCYQLQGSLGDWGKTHSTEQHPALMGEHIWSYFIIYFVKIQCNFIHKCGS